MDYKKECYTKFITTLQLNVVKWSEVNLKRRKVK